MLLYLFFALASGGALSRAPSAAPTNAPTAKLAQAQQPLTQAQWQAQQASQSAQAQQGQSSQLFQSQPGQSSTQFQSQSGQQLGQSSQQGQQLFQSPGQSSQSQQGQVFQGQQSLQSQPGQFSQQGQFPQQGQGQAFQSQSQFQPQGQSQFQGGSAIPDTQVQSVLNAWTSFNAPPLEVTTYEVGRQLPSVADAIMSVAPGVQAVGKIEHRIIQGPGGQLLMRFYYPQGNGPFPVVVYFHGGGFVIANLDTYDASARALTNAANAIVVSVAYRQAPEHPFPAAADDAYAAYQWVQRNAASFNGNPNKVAVAGESAGGNLAAGIALRARNQGAVLPVLQLLIYPVTDFYNTNYTSYAQNNNSKPLNTVQLGWFGGYYLQNSTDKTNYLASPLLARSFSGLPPAFIITADIDPLRDQGEAYRAKLQQAGVPTAGSVYYGVPHEFFGMSAVSDTARRAVNDAGAALTRAFAS